jgi:hypothetical protein
MDDYKPVSAAEYQRLMAILKTNANKSFVQRILRPDDFPTLDLGNGQHATHRMSWGEAGGKYYVYPTVLLQEGGKLHDYGDNAWDHAIKGGNYIEFDSPQDAEWFSQRYKGAWGGRMNNEPK